MIDRYGEDVFYWAFDFSLDTFCARACSLGNVYLKTAWSCCSVCSVCMGKCYLMCAPVQRWWNTLKKHHDHSLSVRPAPGTASRKKTSWGPCSGLLTWWLIHFRSFDNLNPLVNNKKIECKHRALHQHETQFNAVSPWRLAGDHSQVQIQPWHLPAADYFNEHVPTLQGSKAQTIPDLKSKSWLCRTHLGRRMLDLQGPSRRLKRKWGQVWRNYPCVSIQAVAATPTSFQRFNWTFFIGLDCSSRPAPQLRRGMMIQCTYTTSPEHPTDQPKTSILQTSRKHPKNSKAIFFGGAAKAMGVGMKIEAGEKIM